MRPSYETWSYSRRYCDHILRRMFFRHSLYPMWIPIDVSWRMNFTFWLCHENFYCFKLCIRINRFHGSWYIDYYSICSSHLRKLVVINSSFILHIYLCCSINANVLLLFLNRTVEPYTFRSQRLTMMKMRPMRSGLDVIYICLFNRLQLKNI
jgi:hypothetical protein